MSDIPTPRSFEQILGEMISAFLARTGVPNLRIGSPILSLMEAAAQSDFRGSQDVFQILNSLVLDRATGLALDRIGADELVERIAQSPATGTLTITDTSFEKLESRVYQGGAAPIVGTQNLLVEDALDWAATGSLYIGRGTNNYEGPIAYTSKTLHVSGAYWTIALATATTRFHNVGETVIVAQGGNRSISAGTVVRTPQGNASTAAEFSTLYAAVIPDGETEVLGVAAVARQAGVIGNIAAGAITEFVSAPFTGATVTNPSPFTNGLNAEDDGSYRERIRDARQSRTKGTAQAIKTFVIGITALDENKRVLSDSLIVNQGEAANLYIDDGTGYEEKVRGIAYEIIEDSASGGEKYFQLENGRPVAKAQVECTLTAPFAVEAGSQLRASVGGVDYAHVFSASDFLSSGSVSAYEIVSSINADAGIEFGARTSSNGQKVVLFARADSNEDIQVLAAEDAYVDANDTLGFPTNLNRTLWLYKNDRLLNKDGSLALIQTKQQSLWGSIASGATLTIKVDGIPVSITITDQDFVDAGTSYVTVAATNSLASWATVFNYKIPGVTADVNGAVIDLVSNLDRSARASLEIVSGSLSNIFADLISAGAASDYTLDRNLGQIKLNVPLAVNDRLTAGSLATRSFLETEAFTAKTVAADVTSETGESGAELWFVVDGAATAPLTGIGPGTSFAVSITSSPAWGRRIRYTSAGSSVFNLATVGDWLIVTDSAFNIANRGAWRIIAVDTDTTKEWVEIERPTGGGLVETINLTNGNVRLIQTDAVPQRVYIPAAANYTALSLSTLFNTLLVGATAQTYRTTTLRVRTNTFDGSGDIALVAWNLEGSRFGLPMADAEASGASHLASIRANQEFTGTPEFSAGSISTVTSDTVVTLSAIGDFKSNLVVVGLKTTPESGSILTNNRYGNDNHVTTISDITGAQLTTRIPVLKEWLPEQRVYAANPYAITARDQFAVVANGDEVTGRYVMNAYRRVNATTGSYGLTNLFSDADNGGVSLAKAFGTAFDWEDFAVHMKARVKANGIMWRYYRHGPEGNAVRVRYTYPTAANQTVTVTSDTLGTQDKIDVSIRLPAGAARTGYTVRNSSKVGCASPSVSAGLSTNVYVYHLLIASASRAANVSTLTLTLPPTITDHGLQIGDAVWVNSTSGNFSTGVKLVTARTATTISYAEIAANAGPEANIGTVSNDNSGEVSLSGGSIVVGDLMNFSSASSVPTAHKGTVKLNAYNNDYVTAEIPAVAVTTVLTWGAINNTANLAFFPVGATNSVTAISAAVNAVTNTPVTGFVYGAGNIEYASYEAIPNGLGGTYPYYDLVDGINFVASHSTPPNDTVNYSFTFKNAVDASLAASSDWAAEDVRLVPITALNWSNWLASAAIGGLFSTSEIQLAGRALSPQITGITSGSTGSIEVSGGFANSAVAAITGSAALSGTNAVVSVDKAIGEGLGGDMWVRVDNTTAGPKTIITATTTLTSITTGGVFTFNSGFDKAWKYSNDAANLYHTNRAFQIEKQGDFTAFKYVAGAGAPALASVSEGDWVVMTATTGTLNDIPFANDLNLGTYRIVRVNSADQTFWIENPATVEEVSRCNIAFIDFNSIMPGDTLTINTSVWGAGNVGSWVVSAVDFSAPANRWTFTVTGATAAQGAVAALGANSGLIQVYEANPTRLFKKIVTVGPNASNANLVDLKFKTNNGYALVGEPYGSVVTALDKLRFGVDTASGVEDAVIAGLDGYLQNTGLIAEANKVVYGDESDTATYPGVAAAGAAININGPLVRRISVSLSIRVKTGVSTADIRDKVKSAVATVINQTPVGQSVAFSDLISAAQDVNGVVAVAILSPSYSSTSDLISVQPQEKPLVISIDQDILVSLVGE